MREVDRAGPWLVLLGSADVDSRPEVPLSFEDRSDVLTKLLARTGLDAGTRVAPLAERKTNGWDAEWAQYLLGAARDALGVTPTHYVFGSDYPTSTFKDLVGVQLVCVPREGSKSSRELRHALASGDVTLHEKYALELQLLSPAQRERIARLQPKV
jgi:hypothetical protein